MNKGEKGPLKLAPRCQQHARAWHRGGRTGHTKHTNGDDETSECTVPGHWTMMHFLELFHSQGPGSGHWIHMVQVGHLKPTALCSPPRPHQLIFWRFGPPVTQSGRSTYQRWRHGGKGQVVASKFSSGTRPMASEKHGVIEQN